MLAAGHLGQCSASSSPHARGHSRVARSFPRKCPLCARPPAICEAICRPPAARAGAASPPTSRKTGAARRALRLSPRSRRRLQRLRDSSRRGHRPDRLRPICEAWQKRGDFDHHWMPLPCCGARLAVWRAIVRSWWHYCTTWPSPSSPGARRASHVGLPPGRGAMSTRTSSGGPPRSAPRGSSRQATAQ